jgi:CRISPR-associated protein Csd2
MGDQIKNRYDFVMIFDVKDGNPNGDPDAGNLPRIDAETGMGVVTDVCLKRKIRNYIQLKSLDANKYDIYIKEKSVLGRAHTEAFQNLGIKLGEGNKAQINEEFYEALSSLSLPDGFELEKNEEADGGTLLLSGIDKKEVEEWLKDTELTKEQVKFIKDAVKKTTSRKPTGDETEKGRDYMCKKFYDIRTFGAVLSLKSAPNCGQVRGPVQLTFARSTEPIVALEHTITRVCKTTEDRATKGGSEMGRKFTVPYGVYRAHGFISANLASQTGFDEDDLKLFWEAVINMFEHDHSAARGEMNLRKLIVFKHETALGNAPAHKMFDRVSIVRKDSGDNSPARSFEVFNVVIDKKEIPEKVVIIEMV